MRCPIPLAIPGRHSPITAHSRAIALSCAACHHMAIGDEAGARVKDQAQNRCIVARQTFLNGTNSGFARTFTGRYLLGPPDALQGPFADPKRCRCATRWGWFPCMILRSRVPRPAGAVAPWATGDAGRRGSRPDLRADNVCGMGVQRLRTGSTPDGALPAGAGARRRAASPATCRTLTLKARAYKSEIASIQEVSNFPQAENVLPARELDLPVRSGYTKHVLVGLNLFLEDGSAVPRCARRCDA